MFDTIEDLRQTRKKYNAEMFQCGISTFREAEEMEARVLRDGHLPQKQKELIALGISISQKCLPCIEYHVSAALQQEATRAEVIETVALAVALCGGTAMWPARFAFKVLDELEAKHESR